MRELRNYTVYKKAVEDLFAECRHIGRGKIIDLGVYGSTKEFKIGSNTIVFADMLCGASLATVSEIIAAVPLQKCWMANLQNIQIIAHSESLKFSEVMATHVVTNNLDLEFELVTDCYQTYT